MTSGFEEALAHYLPQRRWFAGKGRDFVIGHVHRVARLGTPGDGQGPVTDLLLVTVSHRPGVGDSTDPGLPDVYQIPVGYLDEPAEEWEHALIGTVDDPELGSVVAYDAVFLPGATSRLMRGFHAGRTEEELEFHAVEDGALPAADAVGTVLSAEQSNTSLVYGDDAILKLFRRVHPGRNPDIEVHAALTRTNAPHIAPLLGWLHGSWIDAAGDAREGDLGMLQVLLRTASDGWDLALASLRDLLVEADLHPDEVGGDFAGESERLGEAVATVHLDLASAFGRTDATPDQAGELADGMVRRLDAAVSAVPALSEFAAGLRRRFDELRTATTAVPLQRVHGDLHLGQTLRTAVGWKIIDFEGEPAKPLAERTLPSPVARDVAGMLRSFDYAAGAALHEFGTSPQLRYRADEWNARNRDAFLAGYLGIDPTGADALPVSLVAAFEADKAVYEAVYEARHRPGWLAIPLRAIARIAADDHDEVSHGDQQRQANR